MEEIASSFAIPHSVKITAIAVLTLAFLSYISPPGIFELLVHQISLGIIDGVGWLLVGLAGYMLGQVYIPWWNDETLPKLAATYKNIGQVMLIVGVILSTLFERPQDRSESIWLIFKTLLVMTIGASVASIFPLGP